MSASCPPSTRSTSASTVASPHSSRWLPRTQRSPGLLTGSSGGSGTSSSASSLAVSPSAIASSRSSSGGVEADQVEVEALVPQPSQLLRQQRVVPAGLQGELVVGDQVRPLLRLAEVLEADHRHLGEPELARREQPAVASQDPGVLVDQDRVGPAELDHRGRDLIDLRLAVRARVALVRAQAVDRPELDPLGERDQPGALRCVGQVRTSWCDGWCEPGCDACDGSQAGSHPGRAQNLRNSAGFRRSSATGSANCEPGICGLSLAKYRAGPPRISIRQGRTQMC